MIDHVSIAVGDLKRSAAFYAAVLEPLGYRKIADRPASVGFGKQYPEFWLNARPNGARAAEDTGAHICLRARSVEAGVGPGSAWLITSTVSIPRVRPIPAPAPA